MLKRLLEIARRDNTAKLQGRVFQIFRKKTIVWMRFRNFSKFSISSLWGLKIVRGIIYV